MPERRGPIHAAGGRTRAGTVAGPYLGVREVCRAIRRPLPIFTAGAVGGVSRRVKLGAGEKLESTCNRNTLGDGADDARNRGAAHWHADC